MATEAVLDTYELLESILLILPATDIIRSKKVSKTWRTLIKNSTRLRQACVVAPERLNHDSHFEFTQASVPQYPESANLRLNPVLKANEFMTEGKISTIVLINPDTMAHYRAAEEEYLTSPPCQSLSLLPDYTVSRIINVQDGIRIKDVLDKVEHRMPSKDRSRPTTNFGEFVGCQYEWWQGANPSTYGPKTRSLRSLFPVVDEDGLRLQQVGKQAPKLRYTGQRRPGWEHPKPVVKDGEKTN